MAQKGIKLFTLCFFFHFSYSPKTVVMAACLDDDAYNEKWELTHSGQIRSKSKDLCLDFSNLNPQDSILLRKCDAQSETQKWIIEN